MKWVWVSGLLMAAIVAQPQPLPEPPQQPARVLVISLDGARPDAIQQAETPHLHTLAERGAVSWAAQTVYPSITLPSHTSMLTGLDVDTHGVDYNGILPNCPPVESPTFLTLAAEAGYSTAMIVGKEKFCLYQQRDDLDYTFAREGDRSVADRVIELLDNGYEIIFAHFPNPDYFGHLSGWMGEEYIRELSNTDAQVGRLLDHLDELVLTDETLVIVTADHGGHDTVHGSDSPEDMTIPWIIAGPGVTARTVLTVDIHTSDTAATVLWALGLPLPDNAVGRPVIEAFGLDDGRQVGASLVVLAQDKRA